MMDYQRVQHALWECKYQIVFIPQYRRKAVLTALRKELGPVVRELARRKGGWVEEGHWRSEHVPMLGSIPPTYAVAARVGDLKGKRAIPSARTYRGKDRTCTGEHFWARGYCVSSVGADDHTGREYMRNQEEEDMRLDHLTLLK